ncbi:hypothetical protein [Streptomyces sp. NPDC057115]|uniref:hypothetical protein n=1 Tax=Streptomyces sp. NPDC057115 TaxID=3346022 RepID=UPI003643A225
MDYPAGITDLDGNEFVSRQVVLPDGSTGGIACTPEKSAELADEDVVAILLQQWPNAG